MVTFWKAVSSRALRLMGDIFAFCLLGVLGLLLVSAGIEDARTREIANRKTASIALLAPLWWWSLGLAPWPDMAWQVGIAAIVFAVFVAAFAVGQMGGGDVKLIGALALWLPLQPFVTMFMWMTIVGGALTAIMVVDEWVRRRATPPSPSPLGWGLGATLLVAVLIVARTASVNGVGTSPFVLLSGGIGILTIVSVLLVMAIRSAKRRGIAPETPYGVAIAIAGLLALREPIINQFG